MKRIFTLVVAAMLAGQAWAETSFAIGGLKYTVTDETNHTVSVSDAGGSTIPPADLVIPSEVVYNNVTYYVTSLSNQAFWGTDNLKTVIIPNTVSSIGNEAFRSCSSLTAIIIPNSVTAISGGMFNGCGKLASISMSENIQTIGGYAFYGCKSLTSITLPETLTNISVNVFEGCTGLKILTVPSTVATIGANAFKQVKKVVYAGPATGSWGCSNLIRGYYDGNFIYTDAEKTHVIEYYGTGSGVTVPNTVTTIADNAFKNSTGLTSITIPESVTEISPLAFVGCDVTLNVDGNANYAVADGVLFNADQTALIGCYQPLAGAYTIPNTVESIGSLAGCADLATIVIPASVATVGGGAFANCDNLEIYCEAESKPEGWDGNWNPDDRHVTWGVISCGDYILLPTSGTEHTVEVSNYIGSDASITIPESFEIGGVEYSVTKIGDYAFKSCSNLTSITIPVSVTEISPLAFAGCNVTLNVEENTNYSAEDGVLFNNDRTVLIGCYKPLTSYNIPSTVKTIELFPCPSLTSVSIPSSVETIDSAAFADCSSLTSVTTASNADYSDACLYFISNGIKYKVLCIDSVEVVKHSYTGEVVVAASVTAGSKFNIVSIAPEAFKDCTGLTAIQIHINVRRVGANAFSGCNKLTSIIINSPADFSSAGLQFVKNDVRYKVLNQDNIMVILYNVRFLTSMPTDVVIPETVTFGNTFTITGIGKNAYASSMTSVVIPNTVTFIENDAFTCSQGLKSINIPKSVTKIGSGVFYLCPAITSLTVESDADFSESDLQFKKDGIYYTVLSKNTVEVANKLYNSDENLYKGDVVIPEKVNPGSEFTVVGIAVRAFKSSEGLTSVTIPNSVKSIGANAFEGCKNMTSVTIPSSVTTIGQSAFYGCSGLTSFTIPQGVTDIYNGTFVNCTGLKSVTIHKSVTSIYSEAFKGCNNIETLTYNTDAIGTCFSGKTKLKTVNIGSSVTSIAQNAFSGCTGLTSITIPDNVTAIGDDAFKNCSGLTSLTIPDGVTTIGSSAFRGCSGLKSVTIPESVTSIGYWAFDGCNSIETLTYNTNAIGSHYSRGSHFCSNASLKTVNIGNSVNSIVSGAFQHCTGLTSLTIPNSVENIGSYAFYNCTGLTTVTIPNSVKIVEEEAFKDCAALTSIFIDGDADYSNAMLNFTKDGIKYNVLDKKSVEVISCSISDTAVIIPGTVIFGNTFAVRVIANNAFKNQTELTSVMIPATVTNIGESAFSGCSSLESIVIPDSVESIGKNAFNGCSGVKSVVIPSSVKSIGDYAFYGCNSIETLTYNTDAIGSKFSEMQTLKTINIGDSVTKISSYAFEDCTSLTTISVGKSVTNIGRNAFAGCRNLTLAVIPESVAVVGAEAFSNCGSPTIFCGAESQPDEWNNRWNSNNYQVVWSVDTEKEIWCVTVASENDAQGSVEGGGFVVDGTETTIIAKPANGCHFAGWSDGNTNNPRTITAMSDTAFVALFGAHIATTDTAVAATCTESGLTEGSHCAVCGKVLEAQEVIYAKGHPVVTDVAEAATCTESGLTEGSHCSVCGTVIVKQDTIPAKGHTIVIDEAVEPTCTETGLGEGKHCAVCNEFLCTQELLPPLGHEFVNYIYNNDATTEADGTETAVCERGCGATDTRIAEGTKLATAISESVAGNLMVHAHGKSIIVENAEDEIRVYDAMGRLIGRDAINRVRAEIVVNTPGVYLVKVGNVAKRVMVSE